MSFTVKTDTPPVVAVTLNPCLDWTVAVDRLQPDDISRVAQRWVHPGGKGLNVSRALRVLGTSALNLAVLAGACGQRWAREVTEAGLAAEIIWVEGETRTNLNILETATSRQYRLNEPGPAVTLSQLEELARKLEGCCQGAQWVVFSGSLPPGLPQDTYRQLARVAHAAGCQVALDTDGAALAQGLAGKPELLKPNLHELARLMDTIGLAATRLTGDGGCALEPLTDQELALSALALIDRGVREVVVSMGGGGAVMVNPTETWRAAPPKVEVQSTVGLGDALLAGILHGNLRGQTPGQQLRTGIALAAAKALTPGVEPPRQEDFKRLYQEVGVATTPI